MEVDSSFEIAPKILDKEFKRPAPIQKPVQKKTHNASPAIIENTLKRVTFSDFARDNTIVVIVFAVIIVLLICVILYFTILKDKLAIKEKGAVLPLRQAPYPYDPRMMQQYSRGPPPPAMQQYPSGGPPAMNTPMEGVVKNPAPQPTNEEKIAHLRDILVQTAGLDTDDEAISENESDNETENEPDNETVEPSENEDTIENAINAIELID